MQLIKAHMHRLICSARKSAFSILPLLLKHWSFKLFLTSQSCWAAMLGCFGWSYCSFKPALRDTDLDMWHQYPLTIPLAHKRQPWILGSQYHYRFAAAVTHNNRQGAWKAVWGLVRKTSPLRWNCLFVIHCCLMGLIILRKKNMGSLGSFHTENTCQTGLKDLHRRCHEKEKKKKII